MNFEVGQKVQITTEDGIYEGLVHLMDEENGKIVLKKVYSSGRYFHGVQCFFEQEIIEGQVLKSRSLNEKLEHTNEKPVEIECMIAINASDKVKEPEDNKSVEEAENKQMKLEHQDYLILEKLDNTFHKAINHIRGEEQIGLGVEGINIGRNGKICWLQIATSNYVFFFDMLCSADDFLKEGLKAILEDFHIVKIVHDCRPMSDALYHCYGTSLVNVYDTQVADVLVYKLFNGGNFPRYVNGLSTCLLEHLKLDTSCVYFPQIRMTHRMEDQSMWKKRPLTPYLIGCAMKNVIHLKELHRTLNKKLLSELTFGVDIYLGAMRDAREEELAVMPPHLLPAMFQTLLNNACRKKVRHEIQRNENDTFDHCGFKNNHIPILNPNVIYSRDSWHEGQKSGRGGKYRTKFGDKRYNNFKDNSQYKGYKENVESSIVSEGLIKERSEDPPATCQIKGANKTKIIPAGLQSPNVKKSLLAVGKDDIPKPVNRERQAVGRGILLKKLLVS